jgi:hypothetical protein
MKLKMSREDLKVLVENEVTFHLIKGEDVKE